MVANVAGPATWLPRLGSRGKHRVFLSRGWSTARMWHWDTARQMARCVSRKKAAISSQPDLRLRGMTFVRGDRCLSKEEQTASC